MVNFGKQKINLFNTCDIRINVRNCKNENLEYTISHTNIEASSV